MGGTKLFGFTAVSAEPRHESRLWGALRRRIGSGREPARKALRWLLTILAVLWVILVLGVAFLWGFATLDPITFYSEGPAIWLEFLLLLLSILFVSMGIATYVGLHVQRSRARAAARSWVVGLGFLFLMAALRVFGSRDPQLLMISRSVVGLIFLGWLYLHVIRREKMWAANTKGIALAAAFGGVLALPWLVVGALGSPLDTLLALVAGAILGLLASWLIAYVAFPAFLARPCVRRRDVFLAGLVAAVLLLLLVADYGTASLPPVVLLELPALGWLIAVLARVSSTGSARPQASWPAVAVLVAITVGSALALVDPSAPMRYALGHGSSDWFFIAPLIASVMAVLLALLTGILGSRRLSHLVGYAGWRIPVGLCSIGCGIYFAFGHPGFNGGHMLVVLREQTDLSGIEFPMSLDERRWTVLGNLVSTAGASQSELRRSLDRIGLDYTPYYIVNAIELTTADFPIRWWLEHRPDVDHVEATEIIRPVSASIWQSSPVVVQAFPEAIPWNIQMTKANLVWDKLSTQGEGIVIGHIDTGVDLGHPELTLNYRGRVGWGGLDNNYNWYDPAGSSPKPIDPDGHGTGTLSAAVGQHLGVAPRAKWTSCASFSEAALPTSNEGRFLSCLQFMLAPFPSGGDPIRDGAPWLAPNILTISLSTGTQASTLDPVLRAFQAAGVFVVTSAGNDGLSPGWFQDSLSGSEEVLAVGAVKEDGTLSSFSSAGPIESWQTWTLKPELVAPGEQVPVAAPAGAYVVVDGTSFAAPQVAGVVALMWSAEPDLIGDIARTKEILELAGRGMTSNGELVDLAPASGDSTCFQQGGKVMPFPGYGYGIVDAYEAVLMAKRQGCPGG